MATEDQMKKIQDTLDAILKQNASLVKEVEMLKKDNKEMKELKGEKEKRILEKKVVWSELEEAGVDIAQKIRTLKEELEEDGVSEEFFRSECKVGEIVRMFQEIGGIQEKESTTNSGEEPVQMEEVMPFSNNAREERMDCFFGEDNNMTPVAMRRFVERYKTIKKMNRQLRITGWDKAGYRAGKIKLSLKGPAFDYVEFACKMEESWTDDDDLLLEKLQDKFIKVQAIEMSILQFEQSVQENREGISEFMGRLKRLVREAYDGDSQQEMDRKVAWRFVSGLTDRNVRDKIIDGGWMRNRQEAKELDELQRIAEQTKRNDEASRAMSKNSGHISLFEDKKCWESELDTIAAFSSSGNTSGSRSKTNSPDSAGSSRGGSSRKVSTPDNSENFECYYCRTKSHRGGWFHCPKRKKENPAWKPKNNERTSNNRKDFQ